MGNEFGAVEALWSQFEGVMAQEEGKEGEREEDGAENGEEEEEEDEENADAVAGERERRK